MTQYENMTAEHYQVDTDLPMTNFSHCHIGILHHLDRLSELLLQLGNAAESKKIAKEALDYFQLGMKAHHQEEELELFPAVLSSALPGEERIQVAEMIEKLTHEHRELESSWLTLERALKEIVKGQTSSVDHVHFVILIKRYKAHASAEESVFLPLAEKILSRNSNHMAALGLSLHMRHVPHIPSHI
jgi:hemerythrin-like domain-containing protein